MVQGPSMFRKSPSSGKIIKGKGPGLPKKIRSGISRQGAPEKIPSAGTDWFVREGGEDSERGTTKRHCRAESNERHWWGYWFKRPAVKPILHAIKRNC